jgi:LPPG:FO 2-phospho-L-lactate transferase
MSVVAISGGVGGAKLSLGLYRSLPQDTLKVVVNTGDDFTHMGLRICPDLDTALYTLSGLDNPAQGWGRRDETWSMHTVLGSLGGETWFQIGDGDAALHLLRTERLHAGESLTAIMDSIRIRLGIRAELIPMSDSPVETMIDTNEGELRFQDYFVRRRCDPAIRSIRFAGAEACTPSDAVLEAFGADDLEAIVICPSNPYLSVDPILAVPGIRRLLEGRKVPAVAVSPIIGGAAIKGPTSKIMAELGVDATSASIAAHYAGLVDALVVDESDLSNSAGLALPVFATRTLMKTLDDRDRVARFVLDCVRRLR